MVMQWDTGVHGMHVVGSVLVRQKPVSHVVHRVSEAVLQVTEVTQLGTGVHCGHCAVLGST